MLGAEITYSKNLIDCCAKFSCLLTGSLEIQLNESDNVFINDIQVHFGSDKDTTLVATMADGQSHGIDYIFQTLLNLNPQGDSVTPGTEEDNVSTFASLLPLSMNTPTYSTLFVITNITKLQFSCSWRIKRYR